MLHVSRPILRSITKPSSLSVVSATQQLFYSTSNPARLRQRHTTVTAQHHVSLNSAQTTATNVKRLLHAHPANFSDRLDAASLPQIVNQSPEEFAAELNERNKLHAPAKIENAFETLINHHSNTPTVTPADLSADGKPHKDLPDAHTVKVEKLLPKSTLNFDSVAKAFAIKSNYELIRSLIVFRLCAWEWLVRHARTMVNLSYKILGNTITNTVLRHTFFAHFCAGESGEEIGPVIQKLEQSGVGAILDYAAEADVGEDDKRDREGVVSARIYDYQGEAECDANAQICLACIEDAGRRADGFAAIKLTALGKPELLQHLSTVLNDTKTLFASFLEKKPAANISGRVQQIDVKARVSYDMFCAGLEAINVKLSDKTVKRIFKQIDSNHSGDIDYLEWISFLDPRLLGGLKPQRKVHNKSLKTLSDDSLKQLNNMIARLEILAERASERGVRLMIDAEQTYFQPAIDHLVLGLQRKYNRTIPLIYNTYQCYLKDSHSRLVVDIERAHREGFLFAAKTVRGAYMVQERRRAEEMNYEDPILPSLNDTHDNYDKCVDYILQNIDIADIMVATHNEQSVKFVEGRMRELSIPAKGGGVFFGQLLGMCDHVTFTLGVMGFSVFKYVPYGQIHEVIPYLLRRAEENSNLLGSATKERQLIAREIVRRLTPGMVQFMRPLPAE